MFRLVNVDDRAALHHGDDWYDLATLAGDPSLADPMVAIERHDELHLLDARCEHTNPSGSIAEVTLRRPVPSPRQVFAIGLNYVDHAEESGMSLPAAPMVFTKFPSCIADPTATIPLSGAAVDWEVEIVAVIGRRAHRVAAADAWDVVAGLTLGQDISDRAVQLADQPPQFSMGKSFPNYGPIGPAVVSTDGFADRDDIGLWCEVDGERMQQGRSRDLLFSIPRLVAYLSSVCTLEPGDLVFTGTPSGVGMGRGVFLAPGQVLRSGAEMIGELENRCVEGAGAAVA